MGRHILSLQRKGSHHNDLVLHSQFPPLLKQIIVKFYNINGEALSLCLFLWCACQCLSGHFISPVKNSLQFMGVVTGVPWHPRFPSSVEGKRGATGRNVKIFSKCVKEPFGVVAAGRGAKIDRSPEAVHSASIQL